MWLMIIMIVHVDGSEFVTSFIIVVITNNGSKFGPGKEQQLFIVVVVRTVCLCGVRDGMMFTICDGDLLLWIVVDPTPHSIQNL